MTEILTRRETGLDVGPLRSMLDGDAVAALFELTVRHNNSALADVSCYFVAKTQGLPLLTGDGQLRRQAV